MAYTCLKNILQTKKIFLNSQQINLEDCIICDIFKSSITKFNYFHTDVEYETFFGNGFNVWYLSKNNKKTGNMFLLDTDEYDKKNTPCYLLDDYKNNIIKVAKQSYINNLLFYHEIISTLDINKISFKYLNMLNGECLVMSKHLLHRTDLSRDKSFEGFNFRVIIKNKDGSIDYNGDNKHIKLHHYHDKKNHKLYNVKLFDFI